MGTRKHARARTAVAVFSGLALMLAACGSDDEESDPTAAPVATTSAVATTSSGGATTTSGGAGTATTSGSGATTTTGASTGTAGCDPIDTSLDEERGTNAGRFFSDLKCADKSPLVAEGEPIVIGFQNPEGDPNGSFPEFSLAAEAAVRYINEELGGLGADIQNGVPGRPIQLELCKMAISPDDSQRCANELLSKEPAIVISSLNFFGNHFPVYAAAKVPVIVSNPITVGDYTFPDVYSIGAGGGCLGVHTGMVKFITQNLGAKRVSIPWADTPPGVVCYYDLEAKPMDVLAGKVEGDSPDQGSIPDLAYVGVPMKPATADVTPIATQILDFDPDGIMFSGQGADCWNLVAGLGRLGWTPEQIPLVLSGACTDFDAMKAAGDLAKGVYFVGSSGTVLNDPATITNPVASYEASVYQTKPSEYGLPASELRKGFATQGFTTMLSLWELSSQIVVGGDELTGQSIAAAYKSTDGQHLFGSTPLSCTGAPEPYVAVCNSQVSITQWDGTKLETVVPLLSGIDLVAGTEIKPGP